MVLIIAFGFPIALILAWAFELTPEGIKRTEFADELPTKAPRNRAWIYVVTIGGAISIGLFFLGRYTATSKQSGSVEALAKSIAVLPLVNTSADPGNDYFSDGLSEELIAVLAKIPGLKIIGRSSSFLFKGKSDDSRDNRRKAGRDEPARRQRAQTGRPRADRRRTDQCRGWPHPLVRNIRPRVEGCLRRSERDRHRGDRAAQDQASGRAGKVRCGAV